MSGVSTSLVLILFYIGSDSCYLNPFCNDTFLILFLIPPALFLLSLITYKMKDEVFQAWWRFARWWVLVIIAVTLFLQNVGGGGGIGISSAVSGAFDILVLGILYTILVVVSLFKIIRAYSKSKGVL